MKKAHGLTVLALLLGTTLVGCSNNDEEPEPSASVSESTAAETNEESNDEATEESTDEAAEESGEVMSDGHDHSGETAEEHAKHVREVKPGETWTPEPFVPQGKASASPVAEPEGGSGVVATDDVSLEPLD